MHPIIYLPIEIKNREFDSRILIAAHCLEAGFPVVIGQQWSIFGNVTNFPLGLVTVKTVNAIQARFMAVARNYGHLVAATDEEVLAMGTPEGFLKVFSPITVDASDVFLAQSQPHRDALVAAFPEMASKTVITGNPRIDLMGDQLRQKFDAEVRKIKKDVGPFVLFNTNFSITNSVWGDVNNVAGIAQQAGVLDKNKPETVTDFKDNIDFEIANRNAMVKVLQWAATNLRNHRIVIRPHPGEKPEFWIQAANNHPRLTIIPRSHHLPWILASDLVVHTSCTTGLEASILGKPSLNLSPEPHTSWYKVFVMGKVNLSVQDMDEATRMIDQFLHAGTGPIADDKLRREEMLKFFPNLDTKDASKLMVDEFKRLFALRAATNNAHDLPKLFANMKRLPRTKVQIDKMSASAEEFTQTLAYLQQSEGLTQKVSMHPLDDSLYLIVPEQAA